MTRRYARPGLVVLAWAVWGAVPGARAGGGPENAVVVIDPRVPESVYVGHYYANARDVPPQNVLYMSPGAANFTAFNAFQRQALLGVLTNRALDDHIDFVVVTPGTNYFVSAPNLVIDGCARVTQFSASSVYTFAHIADTIGPNTPVTRRNQYFSSRTAIAFDSNTAWWLGAPSSNPRAERYFVAGMLGYSGERGNTIDEITDLIDRSVAVDGTRPDGTFYYMKTSDSARSNPRHGQFPSAIQALRDLGASAEMLDCRQTGCNARTVLPDGKHDCLGVMTGWASPDIDGTGMTLLPGSMGDHLTSFAGNFGTGSQTKMSRWIAKGANGSFGTVQEPCNYPGKFPHPRFHVHYFEGLTLGEAGFRSLSMLPWQVLAYGDPLTQPFAFLPDVRVPDAPQGEVSGVIALSPEARTEHPQAKIKGFDLLVNGVTIDSTGRNGAFTLDTTGLPDGHNDVRVVAFDNTDVRAQNRFVMDVVTNNRGHSADIDVDPSVGDRSTVLTIDVSAAGGAVTGIEVMQNGRVVASTGLSSDSIRVHAENLGAGPSILQAVARFDDGSTALSRPFPIEIAFANPPQPGEDTQPPLAFGYTRVVRAGTPMLFELPGTDVDDPALGYTVTRAPSQGTLSGDGPVRLLKPDPRAVGTDELAFKVVSQGVESVEAVVTIVYVPAVPCASVKRLQAKCKRGAIKGKVILTSQRFDGELVVVSVDGAPMDVEVSGKKAKFKLPDQPLGEHVVALDIPPDCVPPKRVECR